MVKVIQPSMAGGEVSPPVGARVDLTKRSVSVERAENFIATFTGSMRSRPGQRFVAECKASSGPYRIIEFEFNTDQTFVLEMGDQYMRFHTLGAQILDSANVKTITNVTTGAGVVTSNAHGLSDGDEVYITGIVGMTELNGRSFLVDNAAANTFTLQTLDGVAVTTTTYGAYTSGGTATPPYEIATPWAAADLFDVAYAQSGDVMTLCHPDYTPRELVRVDNDTWTLTELIFKPSQPAPSNVDITTNTAINSKVISDATKANPCVITSTGHGFVTGDRVLIEDVVGMVQLNNFIYTVTNLTANTFSLTRLDGTVVNSTSFGTYTSDGVATQAIRERVYTVTAVNSDNEEESLRGTSIRDITITGITKANPAVVTTSEGHGLELLDDIEISGVSGMTEVNGERFTTVYISPTSFSLRRLDGTAVNSTAFTTYTSGGVANPLVTRAVASADAEWENTIFWDEAANVEYYNVYATDNFGLLGFIGTTAQTRFEDINLGPDYSVGPPIQYNPFDDFVDGTDLQPSTVGFFGQRRVFANSTTFPNRFWMSQVGHFDNLSRSVPPQNDGSITASISARRINSIQHIVPLADLVFLTSGGEYRAFSDTGVLTPSTISVKPQSYYGTTDVRPIVAGNVALFIAPGEFVRTMQYEFANDSFAGKDITVLARHLFTQRTIVDWDFAPSPYAVGASIMSDGGAVVLTFQPEQDVYGWTRLSTKGSYKSTCVIREGRDDVTYFLVERKINGYTKTFLERVDEHNFTDLSDAFCVDCGLTLDAPITITGATAASPVVITAPSHGLSNGDTVDINGIKEVSTEYNEGEYVSPNYNGTGYTVANATAHTFELQIEGADYDGSGFAAYSSGGEAREAVTTVSGIWHLEGETVVAAGNGYAEKDLVVTDGAITLTAPASRIHIGLGYYSRLITLPLSQYAESGTSEGRTKNVSRLTVQVERSMGMWYGPTLDQMREAKFGLPALYGQPLVMTSDDINVTMKPDWGKKKQVVLEQRDPLPLTILAMIPDAKLGGN